MNKISHFLLSYNSWEREKFEILYTVYIVIWRTSVFVHRVCDLNKVIHWDTWLFSNLTFTLSSGIKWYIILLIEFYIISINSNRFIFFLKKNYRFVNICRAPSSASFVSGEYHMVHHLHIAVGTGEGGGVRSRELSFPKHYIN